MMDKYKLLIISFYTIFLAIVALKTTEAGAVTATQVDCNNFPTVKEENCCDLPTLIDQPILDECDSSFKDKPNATRDCFVNECIFKKRNLIKDDKPSTSNIISMVNEASKNTPHLKQFLLKSVDYCVAKYHSVEANELKKIDNCNPIYEYLTDCFFTYSYLNCPKPAYKGDVEDCKVIKKYLEACATRFL